LFYEVLGDEPVTPEKKAAIEEILRDNKDEKSIIITSVISHIEIIPSKIEQKKPGAEGQYLALFDGKRFLDIEINRNILMRAREIREFYYRPAGTGTAPKIMDAADAVHLATASIYEVDEFQTRDDDSKGTKIPLVSLYKWSGSDKLCAKYELKIVSPEHDQKALALDAPAPAALPPKGEELTDEDLEWLEKELAKEDKAVAPALTDARATSKQEGADEPATQKPAGGTKP